MKKGPERTQGALLGFAIRTNEQPHPCIRAAPKRVGLVKNNWIYNRPLAVKSSHEAEPGN